MSDKKGKGSGTKDACYHKVKARYSVWPSAYASGALVKCRKKGAANWGNSTKKESFEIDPKKHKAAQKDQKIRNMTKSPNENEAKVAAKKAKGPKLMGEDKYDNLAKDISRVKLLSNAKPPADPKKTAEKKARLEKKRGMKLDDHPQYKKEEVEQIEEKKKSGDPCWVGYKQVGMKKKGGKMVPNCVPEETEVSEGKKEMLAKMNASREGFMAKDGPNKAAHDAKQRILKKTKEKMTEEIVQSILEKCWAGYEKKGMKTMFGKRYPNCVKKTKTKKEEVEVQEGMGDVAIKAIRATQGKKPAELSKRTALIRKIKQKQLDSYLAKRDKKKSERVTNVGVGEDFEYQGELMTEEQFDEAAGEKDACYHKVKSRYSVWPSAYASGALVKCRKVGAKNWGNKSKK